MAIAIAGYLGSGDVADIVGDSDMHAATTMAANVSGLRTDDIAPLG